VGLKIQPLGSSSGLHFAASQDKGMQLSFSLWGSEFGKTEKEQPEQPPKSLLATSHSANFFFCLFMTNKI